jgi:hypothetical protein
MFTKHTGKALYVIFGAAVTGAVLTSTPARATDPVEHSPGTINQASVYESTLKFYLHPARLELGIEAPRPMIDHPAVIVARASRMPSDGVVKLTPHPATVAKSSQLPSVHTTEVTDLAIVH